MVDMQQLELLIANTVQIYHLASGAFGLTVSCVRCGPAYGRRFVAMSICIVHCEKSYFLVPWKRLFAEQIKNVTEETQLPMVMVSTQRGKTDESGEVDGASEDTGCIQER